MKTILRFPAQVLLIRVAALLLAFGISLAFAHAPAVAKNDPGQHTYSDEIAKAPAKDRARRDPFAGDPDAVAAGRKLFEQHCAQCHGKMAEGSDRGPSLRTPEVQQAPPGALFWVLTNGAVRRGMPVWSKLPEPQRWQLVSYLKSLGPAEKSSNDGEN
ncbi:MAG TPA: c-type cytochrome [Terriglobales bacterium]|nr:c-type cytochrome [Terriglobales bacterium]